LNNYTSNVSLTLNSIINKNNTQDTSINNILITLPSYLQSATAASTYQPIGDYVVNNTLNNYTSNVSLTLNSIINKNDTQDTSINNILTTLPSYLQSATAASTYQPIGDYVVNNTLNNYTFAQALSPTGVRWSSNDHKPSSLILCESKPTVHKPATTRPGRQFASVQQKEKGPGPGLWPRCVASGEGEVPVAHCTRLVGCTRGAISRAQGKCAEVPSYEQKPLRSGAVALDNACRQVALSQECRRAASVGTESTCPSLRTLSAMAAASPSQAPHPRERPRSAA
jgi:hypothetical protein